MYFFFAIVRPLLAEIQCLVGGYSFSKTPKRICNGFSAQSLHLLCAVIEKRLGLSLGSREVYLNVVGGLRISEPSADLAAAITVISSLLGMPLKPAIAFIGEIGLGGELRDTNRLEIRIAEASKLGFTDIIIPFKSTNKNTYFKKKSFHNNNNNNISNKSRFEKKDTLNDMKDSSVTALEEEYKVSLHPCRNLKEATAIAFDVADVDELIRNFKRKRKHKKEIENVSLENDTDMEESDINDNVMDDNDSAFDNYEL